MKELVKPNTLEDDHQKTEQFCEGYWVTGCDPYLHCIRERVASIDEVDDILF